MWQTMSNSDYDNLWLISGSFADTGTSRSYQQNPTFFPPNRNTGQHVYGWTNNPSSLHNSGQGYVNKGLMDYDGREMITSISIMFEVTASYNTAGCDEKFYTSMSCMFYQTFT